MDAAGLAAAALAAVLGLATVLLLRANRRIRARAAEITRFAERVAAGESHQFLTPRAGDPLRRLSTALSAVVETLRTQRLAGMTDSVFDAALVRETPNGLFIVDGTGRVRRHNRALARLLPPGPDLLGQAYSAIPVAQVVDAIREALEGRAAVERDAVVGGRDLLVRAFPLADGSGALGVLLDITSVRAAERSRREFAANVAHELRTPITAVVGYAESLSDEAERVPADVRPMVAAIDRNARRLMRLAEDVLQLGRIESRDEPLPARDEAVLPLVTAAVERFLAAAKAKEVRVEIDVPATLRARVNADAFDHALGNLLENAMKYTRARGRVVVSGREEGARIRVDVDDDGPGIAPEHLPRLFERFYRADEGRAREAGGSGLGLALVKHLAAAMSGEVTVASVPGNGATFSLWLPAA